MTTDIQLYRPDTGEFAPVRIVDGHTAVSAPYSRAEGILDKWVADARHAADEYSAWLEGQAAQALAEMRALCDELGLPIVWADVQPASVALAERDATLNKMVELHRPVRGWTPRAEDFAPAPDETMPGRPVEDPMYARALIVLPHKRPTKNRLVKRRLRRGLRQLGETGPRGRYTRAADRWLARAEDRLRARFTPVKEEQ